MQLATRIHIIHIQIWYFSNPVHESRIFLPNILPRRGTFHPTSSLTMEPIPEEGTGTLHLSYSIYYSIILSEIAVSAFSSGQRDVCSQAGANEWEKKGRQLSRRFPSYLFPSVLSVFGLPFLSFYLLKIKGGLRRVEWTNTSARTYWSSGC